MKRKKKYTCLAAILAAMCLLNACSFSDKKETNASETNETVTETRTDRTEAESDGTSEGVLESLGNDLKEDAESLGEYLKNGAESAGEEIRDQMDGENHTETPSEPTN